MLKYKSMLSKLYTTCYVRTILNFKYQSEYCILYSIKTSKTCSWPPDFNTECSKGLNIESNANNHCSWCHYILQLFTFSTQLVKGRSFILSGMCWSQMSNSCCHSAVAPTAMVCGKQLPHGHITQTHRHACPQTYKHTCKHIPCTNCLLLSSHPYTNLLLLHCSPTPPLKSTHWAPPPPDVVACPWQ